MKWLRRFLYWCTPGLLIALLSPVAGCFTALSNLGTSFGGGPSKVDKVVAGTLDVVTFPVQLVVFGPLLLCEYIDANTGERGERRREAERWRAEVARYAKTLDEDYRQIYETGEFLSATNTPAREALRNWLSSYNLHKLERTEAERLAARVMSEPELLGALHVVLRQPELSHETCVKAFATMVRLRRERTDPEFRWILGSTWDMLSDDELAQNLSPKDDETDRLLKEELSCRAERREWERQRKAEEEKRRKEEAERQKRERAEQQRAWEKRQAELEAWGACLDKSADEFAKALAMRGEVRVGNRWRTRLRDRTRPLPAENVRALADAVTTPGEPEHFYCRELFLRPELDGDALRRLYPRLLKKLEEGCSFWIAAGLLKNPNLPADLARASYSEPLLVEYRIIYLFHHHFADGVTRQEMQDFEQRVDGLKRDCKAGKITLKECNAQRERLAAKYLPAEYPDDWVKSVP